MFCGILPGKQEGGGGGIRGPGEGGGENKRGESFQFAEVPNERGKGLSPPTSCLSTKEAGGGETKHLPFLPFVSFYTMPREGRKKEGGRRKLNLFGRWEIRRRRGKIRPPPIARERGRLAEGPKKNIKT